MAVELWVLKLGSAKATLQNGDLQQIRHFRCQLLLWHLISKDLHLGAWNFFDCISDEMCGSLMFQIATISFGSRHVMRREWLGRLELSVSGTIGREGVKCFYHVLIIQKQQQSIVFILPHNSKMIDEKQQIRGQMILPILQYKQHIINTIKNNIITLICGQTGSGKTTQVPQYLYPHFKNIIVSQPRRISAITLAQRVAFEMKVNIGEEIGYNVRFQQKRGKNTKVTFATDGMAIRELMVDSHYDLFILDEAHERSINTDVLMSVLKRKLAAQQKHQPFKLIIMSATIQASKFMRFFNTDALIKIQGRSYPTELYNVLEPLQSYFDGAFNAVLQIHYNQAEGDVLVFLTGEEQIVSLHKKLQRVKKQHNLNNLQVLMLYAALPHEYQHKVFERGSDKATRRIILSTNIAETSVTIPGVRYVVDCGYMKVRTYDQQRLLDMLTIVPQSRANALQRAGRAGRQASGKCFQLYPKNAFDDLESYSIPQILRSQLSGPILQLKAIGIPSILDLEFIDQPPVQTFKQCLSILRQIGALTPEPKQEITEYGRELSKLPLPPRLSHLLLLSLQFKCEAIMLSLMSIISIDNLFISSAVAEKGVKKNTLQEVLTKFVPVVTSSMQFSGKGNSSNRLLTSDHLAKVNILHEYTRAQNKQLFCQQNFVNKNNIKRAVLIRNQLQEYLQQIVRDRQKKQFFKLGTETKNKNMSIPVGPLEGNQIQAWIKCMAKGCLYATAKLGKDGRYKIYRSGQEANIHPQSLVFYLPQKPTTIVFSQVVRTTKIYLKDVTPLPETELTNK